MIELTANTALMLYLTMTLAPLLLLWTFQNYRWGKKKIITIEKKVYVCEYCQFAYLDDAERKVTRCPQCELFNAE